MLLPAEIESKTLIPALRAILAKTLAEKHVSACGYGAIAATMIACKNLGSKKGELLAYATSGDIVGNKKSVVGYGSIKFI